MTKPITALCFPFAGGNAYCYQKLKAQLPYEIKTLELPGRGTRSTEPFLKSISALVSDFFDTNELPKDDYFLFGHSMGASLAYEIAVEVHNKQLNMPKCLVVSGRKAPTIACEDDPPDYMLSGQDFLDCLQGYGGTPQAILQEPELMAYFEPILKADLEAIDTYHNPTPLALPIPVLVLVGTEDDAKGREVTDWNKTSSISVDIKWFPGGHFFIFEQTALLKKHLQEMI